MVKNDNQIQCQPNSETQMTGGNGRETGRELTCKNNNSKLHEKVLVPGAKLNDNGGFLTVKYETQSGHTDAIHAPDFKIPINLEGNLYYKSQTFITFLTNYCVSILVGTSFQYYFQYHIKF